MLVYMLIFLASSLNAQTVDQEMGFGIPPSIVKPQQSVQSTPTPSPITEQILGITVTVPTDPTIASPASTIESASTIEFSPSPANTPAIAPGDEEDDEPPKQDVPPATPPNDSKPLPTKPLLTSNTKPNKLTSNDLSLLKNVQQTTRVSVTTSKGEILIDVFFDWSPSGASQFLSLVLSNFYNENRIFRVVPGFVAQFGLNGEPKIQKSFNKSIQDDAPHDPAISNTIGTLTFASHGPNSRSTQVFFNLMDNARLDAMGFTPFAKVTDESLQILTKFYDQYGETPDQGNVIKLFN